RMSNSVLGTLVSRCNRDPSPALRDRDFRLLLDRAQVSQILLRRLQMWEQLLFLLERPRMNATPAAAQLHRMPQVEHFVIDQVLQRVSGNRRAVKDTTHHDGVVGWIVVSQAAARIVAAPRHLGASHESVKEAAIQILENLFQMIVLTLGALDAFATASLANQVGLRRDCPAPGEPAITSRMSRADRPAI